MRLLKPFRVLSLLSAIAYTFIYFICLLDWLYQLLLEDKNDFENDGVFDMLLSMLIFYNLLEHLPIIPINLFIIYKEIQVPIFQLAINSRAPTADQKVDISLIDFENTFNPYWWFKSAFQIVFGYNPSDILFENRADEQHYYKRMIKG